MPGESPFHPIGILHRMGISSAPAQFLIDCRRRLGPFGKTLTLGRQDFKAGRQGRLYALLTKVGLVDGTTVSLEEFSHQLKAGGTPGFFELLGSDLLDAMDISNYEGANIVHDLNNPLPSRLYNCYDTVVDSGTLEHVFNVAEAFRSVMRMVRVGGHFITMTVANNFCNHGLYQFGSEVFYRAFSPENGFEVRLAKFYTDGQLLTAEDPGPAHKSGQMSASPHTTNLFFAARKIAEKEPFRSRWPEQGLYEPLW